MGVFLAILMMMTTGSVAIFSFVRIASKQYPSDERTRKVVVDFVLALLLIFADLIWGGEALVLRLPFNALVCIFPIMILASSLWEEKLALKLSWCMSVPVFTLLVYHIMEGVGFVSGILSVCFISMSGLMSIIISLAFFLGMSLRVREIRQVIQKGNVWSSVCLTVDVIYLMAIVMYITALLISAIVSLPIAKVVAGVVSLLMSGEMAALGLRVSTDSLFVLWRKQERRIVESMKISHADVTQDTSKADGMYKDIYTRLVSLFEEEKIYLNSELTINDIVKQIFTNKLYISRAISQFTGRNFCQFVNYYRVLHSIQLFHDNPKLKVIEMATQSGFNSTVSYSMAFRLYMGECPSDWCRKEKLKLKRRKK